MKTRPSPSRRLLIEMMNARRAKQKKAFLGVATAGLQVAGTVANLVKQRKEMREAEKAAQRGPIEPMEIDANPYMNFGGMLGNTSRPHLPSPEPPDPLDTGMQIMGSVSNLMGQIPTGASGIHIKESKKGTFTAAAKKHGKGVQEFASQVLANKDNYSPAMVKKANFARNASKWKKANGGYTVTRTSERKGKTHKVTGPDGSVKYFGDPNLKNKPGQKGRKKAFYARHKKNLKNNPHFRAYARKTWDTGGELPQGNNPTVPFAKTKLDTAQEKNYQRWSQGKDPSDYDMRGFYLSEQKQGRLKPSLNNYYDSDPNFHFYSRGYDGKILKSPNHPTFQKTIQGEKDAGYEMYRKEDGQWYSRPPKKAKGGGLFANYHAKMKREGYSYKSKGKPLSKKDKANWERSKRTAKRQMGGPMEQPMQQPMDMQAADQQMTQAIMQDQPSMLQQVQQGEAVTNQSAQAFQQVMQAYQQDPEGFAQRLQQVASPEEGQMLMQALESGQPNDAALQVLRKLMG